MSTLQEELARLRTLQESYSELVARIYSTTETVTINLYLPDGASVDWTKHAIAVYDSSDNKQYVYELNADGTCTFEIPSGHQYSIGFPQLATYAYPQKQSFASTLQKRHIVYEYNVETSSEIVRLRVINGFTQATMSILDGVSISVVADSGESYIGTFVGTSCDITIPYGKTCTIEPPLVDGYRSSGSLSFTTGISFRPLVLEYKEEDYGLFGVDIDGKKYSIAECEALEDKTIIKYGYFNNSALAKSTRVDGRIGNSFYWEFGKESIGAIKWSIEAVEFDTSRLPYQKNLGDWKYAGVYATKTIQEIGLELFPDSEDPTPAATACLNRKITISGKDHQGFMLTLEQFNEFLVTHKVLLQSLYASIGRNIPKFWSAEWFASGQLNAGNASLFLNGSNNKTKIGTANIFCAYDNI